MTHQSGWRKVGEKNSDFSRLFQSHNYTFPQVLLVHNNDVHINFSNIIGHHRTLTVSEIHKTLFV